MIHLRFTGDTEPQGQEGNAKDNQQSQQAVNPSLQHTPRVSWSSEVSSNIESSKFSREAP